MLVGALVVSTEPVLPEELLKVQLAGAKSPLNPTVALAKLAKKIGIIAKNLSKSLMAAPISWPLQFVVLFGFYTFFW